VDDLVPELKLIIGEQPPVPELEPQQAQSRFRLVLRRFINVFARPEHPLALFLDDLQWLDPAKEKTAGNPFFVIQFLNALAEEGVLTFHPETAQWAWDLTRAHAKGYTGNLADLMAAKLTRLPADTQTSLQLLACATLSKSPPLPSSWMSRSRPTQACRRLSARS
jgi:predicted ATPase